MTAAGPSLPVDVETPARPRKAALRLALGFLTVVAGFAACGEGAPPGEHRSALATRSVAVRVEGCQGQKLVATYVTEAEVALGANRHIPLARALPVTGRGAVFNHVPVGDIRLAVYGASEGGVRTDVRAAAVGEGTCWGEASVSGHGDATVSLVAEERVRARARDPASDRQAAEWACEDGAGRPETVTALDGSTQVACRLPDTPAWFCVSVEASPMLGVASLWWPRGAANGAMDALVQESFRIAERDESVRSRPRCLLVDPLDASEAARTAVASDALDLVVLSLEQDLEELRAGDRALPDVVVEARVTQWLGADSAVTRLGRALCPTCSRLPFDVDTGAIDDAEWARWDAGRPARILRDAPRLGTTRYVLVSASGGSAEASEITEVVRARCGEVRTVGSGEEIPWGVLAAHVPGRCGGRE